MSGVVLSRRAVLAGGALIVGFSALMRRAGAQDQPGAQTFNDRVELRADGTVHIHVGRVEMGQGFRTAIAQLAADELDVALERVVVAPVDTAGAPNEGYTAGSASMRVTGTAVRRAAAEARHVLLAMAARRLGAPAEGLAVTDGTVEAPGGGRVSYWTLIGGRVVERAVPGPTPLKPAAARRLIGRDVARLDLPAKVSGGAAFVHDLRLPGLRHARVVRPPSPGATLEAVDAAAAGPEARVVRDGSFLAVVAEREPAAIAAAEALRAAARWREDGTLPGREGIFAYLRREAGLAEDPPPPQGGRLATYEVPYRMHGAIGPSCAVAQYGEDGLTVWTHSQGIYPLRAALAELTGLPAARVRCLHLEGAGCFGHNGADDVAADAALIARALPGRPVRVQWSRADEHAWEPYGPAAVLRLSASLDGRGRIAAWSHVVASPTHASRPGGAARLLAARHVEPPRAAGLAAGLGQWSGGAGYNAEPYYDFPARVDNRFVGRAPLRSSALRALGAFANVFAIESFMDELAQAAGADPADFRLAHLSDRRARDTLELALARFGWQSFAARPGHGRGLGFARYNNYAAFAAVAVELRAEPGGGVRLLRAVAATDCGEAINPDGIRSQIEGGIVQAASWALKERVDFDRTRVRSTDWATYPILRMSEAPEVEVHVIDRPGESFLGVGEAAQGPAGAAVANAYAHATGQRVRSLPILPA